MERKLDVRGKTDCILYWLLVTRLRFEKMPAVCFADPKLLENCIFSVYSVQTHTTEAGTEPSYGHVMGMGMEMW